jgi:hypothetical protein
VLTGIADGGPRHGVKLTAAPDWGGVVMRPSYERRTGAPYYPGKYVWLGNKWVWWNGTWKRTSGTRPDETRWELSIE